MRERCSSCEKESAGNKTIRIQTANMQRNLFDKFYLYNCPLSLILALIKRQILKKIPLKLHVQHVPSHIKSAMPFRIAMQRAKPESLPSDFLYVNGIKHQWGYMLAAPCTEI